ncbi:MAG: FimV family protein [Rhodoferax sp.]
MPASTPSFACLPRAFRRSACVLGLCVLSSVALAGAPVSGGALAPGLLAGLGSTHTYTPAVGEALSRIVAKTLPNSPLNAELLAQAFVSLNPQAFSTGGNSRTLTTAALKVPNHNQLVQLVLAKTPATVPARNADKRDNWVRYAGGPVKPAANFDGSAEERKGWVHYLGAAVHRVVSSTTLAETLQWVQYPRVNAAASPAMPQPATDTRNWVRYTAGRSYPVQQFAQLFD